MHEIVQSLMTPIPLIVLFFIQILTSVVLQMDVMSMPIAIIIPARIAVPANLDSLAMENLANVRYMFNNPVTHLSASPQLSYVSRFI